MTVKLPTEHRLEFLSLTAGYGSSSESTLVKLLEFSIHGSIMCNVSIVMAIGFDSIGQIT